jgi:hypothetical protein
MPAREADTRRGSRELIRASKSLQAGVRRAVMTANARNDRSQKRIARAEWLIERAQKRNSK